ncbi:hypothetical protein [Aquimarina sp. AU119]|uniref:hypothetical protein n=1 Tax=Aquimarina sp. AU119 TaxID=2108528 RepID=UPI000D698AC9|nr:hypothetical protein [Aquimarina sp. AU119]
MQKIIYSFIVIVLFQINCNAENIINARLIGFSDSGNFIAIYTYTPYSESYTWKGRLVIVDVKKNKTIDALELEKEYKPIASNTSNEFVVNDLLKSMIAFNNRFLDKYNIIRGNTGYLAYYQPIHEYILKNNDCVSNPESHSKLSIPISSERFRTTNMADSQQFNINFSTMIVDELTIDEDGLGCSECIKKFSLKITDESDKPAFDFENQLKLNQCYRDYFVGSVYFYSENKIIIIAYGMRPGYEGLMIEPIFISGIL